MTDTSLRVRLSEERHAAALAKELGDLTGFDLQRRDGHWDATVDGVLGDRMIVRVLNAVRTALDGEASASAVVFLDGREYEVQAQ
jgi:hypothetical protein